MSGEGANTTRPKRNPSKGGPKNSSITIWVPAICELARSRWACRTACGRIATAALSASVSTIPMTA